MLRLSAILVGDHQMERFDQLLELVKECARRGEMFIEMDIRPPFPDTPENWQEQLEAAFTSADNIR